MNKIVKYLVAVMLFVGYALSASAQLTDAEKKMLERRAAEKVGQMNDYVGFMASKKKSLENRRYYVKKALNLFIAHGNEYVENGVNKAGVMMEVSSVKRNDTHTILMRNYFNNLINLKYSDVKISSTEIAAMKVSNLQQIDDNTYVCTVEYDQAFCGMRDGRAIYKDITTKRVKCYITVEETEDGDEYIVQLGDATCVATRKS